MRKYGIQSMNQLHVPDEAQDCYMTLEFFPHNFSGVSQV